MPWNWAGSSAPWGAQVAVASAQELPLDTLSQTPTVFLGHPRGSGTLLELLSTQPFYVPRARPGQAIRGIVNRSPRAGESSRYGPTLIAEGAPLQLLGENDPDFALITLIRSRTGQHTVSLFGNRYATTPFLVHQLTDPRPLGDLIFRVYPPKDRASGCQIILRVKYLNGRPVDSEYVTHRLLAPR